MSTPTTGPTTDPQIWFRDELEQRLLGWVRVRLLTALLLLLLSLLFRPTLPLPYPIVPVLALVLLLTGFNAFSHFSFTRWPGAPWLGYLQIGMDLFVITAILQSTGGVDSPVSWFYLLLIAAVGLIGGFNLTILVALLSLALYAGVLWGQYFFLLPHYHVGHLATHADAGFHNPLLIRVSILTSAFAFLATGVVAGYVAETAEQRKRKLEANSRLYQEAVFRNVTLAQEDERKRIARELHDETGQSLTSLLFNLQAIGEDSALPAHLRDRLRNLEELTTSLVQGLRTAIANLRPALLDDLGLIPSLKWFLKNNIEPLGLRPNLVVYGQPRRLPDTSEISLYRVIQEALTNVAKHASAREVLLIFRFEEKKIRILIQDDGVGFPPAGASADNKWGIVGMRERLATLGGHLVISSPPGEGSSLTIEIPAPPGPAEGGKPGVRHEGS